MILWIQLPVPATTTISDMRRPSPGQVSEREPEDRMTGKPLSEITAMSGAKERRQSEPAQS